MDFENELALIYDVDCVFNQPVKKHLSLGVGGNAKYFAAPKSLYALKNAVDCAKRHRVPVKIIGGGTNLLVSDDGFNPVRQDGRKFLCVVEHDINGWKNKHD